MARALLIIDIQRDYFPGGAYPLTDPEAAAVNAGRLLAAFRASGEPVIHLQHVEDDPESPFMRRGSEGVEIHDAVRPRDDEPVLRKSAPNGFLDTELEATLRARDVEELVVAGMMSSMCVDATVRAATERGFSVIVAHDACAAPGLEFDGRQIAGRDVHGAFMAALGDGYARLSSTAELA